MSLGFLLKKHLVMEKNNMKSTEGTIIKRVLASVEIIIANKKSSNFY